MNMAVQGTGQCPAEKPRLARSLRKKGRTLTCPLYLNIHSSTPSAPLLPPPLLPFLSARI